MGNQQPSSEQEKVQRPSLTRGVHASAWKCVGLKRVNAMDKIWSVLMGNHKKFVGELHRRWRVGVNDASKMAKDMGFILLYEFSKNSE